jgi:hypothetical protein
VKQQHPFWPPKPGLTVMTRRHEREVSWPSCVRLSRSEYAQRPWPGPVMQRRLYGFNLTIKRNEYAAPVRADIRRLALEDA